MNHFALIIVKESGTLDSLQPDAITGGCHSDRTQTSPSLASDLKTCRTCPPWRKGWSKLSPSRYQDKWSSVSICLELGNLNKVIFNSVKTSVSNERARFVAADPALSLYDNTLRSLRVRRDCNKTNDSTPRVGNRVLRVGCCLNESFQSIQQRWSVWSATTTSVWVSRLPPEKEPRAWTESSSEASCRTPLG